MTFNQNDIKTTNWIEDIIEIDYDDIWKEAKVYNVEPNFENILINVRFKALREFINKEYPEIKKVNWFINSMDSHFYIYDINDEPIKIYSMEDIINISNQLKEQE